uniref:HTH cro/C1-type domain-containing protein n=1 Tax=Aegilops tauschii subsp. strangulata TaxID=200361 RepID=A0A453EFF2_AEGTS
SFAHFCRDRYVRVLYIALTWMTLLMNADNAGTNKAAHSTTSLNTKRLDDDTENLAHERVPSDLKKSIMQARTDKKLTQAQLAQLINEKPQVIQEYESGKAIPNQQIIGKLERALGTKLRGKK